MTDANERGARPRDAEATKALLLAAATAEFAEHGLAGARVDRIAERAGANKRMLYVYFGDKEAVFDAVIDEQTRLILSAAPLVDGDLVAFAAARFDYMLADPRARRLAVWRTLERSEPTEAEREAYRARLAGIEAAQEAGRLRADVSAADLFALVLRITESWLSAPPGLVAAAPAAARELTGQRLADHRRVLLTAVRALVETAEAG